MSEVTLMIPVISSAFGVKFEARMFYKILYEFDKSDIPW
jgi:hypothetical protein